MSENDIRMLDAENAAEDRYELCKDILKALNANDIEKARTIILKDMKIYEDEYLYVPNDNEGKIIELPNCRQTN